MTLEKILSVLKKSKKFFNVDQGSSEIRMTFRNYEGA